MGVIKSPSYPNYYPNDANCTHIISLANGKIIILTFEVFDIEEGDSDGCSYDSLEIRDGSSVDSPNIGKFCGTNIPTIIQSTNNTMWMRYTYDWDIPTGLEECTMKTKYWKLTFGPKRC